MLNTEHIALVKGMLLRGDKQHDIAAHFKINSGRVAEIATGKVGTNVRAASIAALPSIDTGPRYVDPNSPVERQIAVIDSLRRNPPENPRRLRITPELAQHILTTLNPHNRPRRTTDVARYASDMSEGLWHVTGDTIKFGRSGTLRDGQHRLAACVRSGVSFETYVVFGIADESFTVMDVGRKRNGNDVFSIAGIKNANSAAAATRWVLIFTSDRPDNRSASFSNEELLAAYRKLKTDRFDRCVSQAKQLCTKENGLHETSLAALLYVYGARHPKATDAFVADLGSAKGGAKKLVKVITKLKQQNMGRIHENQRNAMLIKTMNAYVNGVAVTEATLRWDESKDFPEFA
jgi:hypothetical protein